MVMKRYPHSAIFLLAALALTGCSKTEEFEHNPDNALQIESVSGISPFALMQEPASKAVISGETLPSEEAGKGIGLFVTATDGTAYDGKTTGYSNVKYAYSNSKWSAASPIYLSNTSGKLYGYFPYSAAATDLKAIPVESSLNSTDYLYATEQGVSFSNKSVNLTMNHALARLHLTIKKGDKYLSDCNLTKIVLQSKSIDANGTMDITTGAVTATKAADATGTFILTGTDAVTKTGIEKDILLVPADNSEGKKDITLTLTIDGVDAEVKFTADKGLDIRSGIQCNATLTIEDTGIKVSGVDVGVWSEGGSQSAKVDGYTVTVKLSDDAADAGISEDLIVQVASNGSSVIVKTYSDSGKPLIIREEDGKLLAPVEEGNKSIFTFSDVTEDITATLAYAKTITVSASFISDLMPNVKDYTKDFANERQIIEGRTNDVTIKVKNIGGYRLDSLVCGKTKVLADSIELKNIVTDMEVKAYYTYTDWLGGVFSISKDTMVRFSRGNLRCEGTGSNDTPTIKSRGFESNQYSTPSNRAIDHISHFMWCKSEEESVKLKYAGAGDDDNLFTNVSPTEPNGNFAVNGQKGFWQALSGGDSGEWKYLIERKDAEGNALYKLGVKVCGSANCLILLPDDWKWGENGVGDNWQDGGYPETSTEGKVTWKTMEAAGAVCLPAAGYRNGYDGDTLVSNVGYYGCYWSSTPYDDGRAYYVYFESGYVDPAFGDKQGRAFAVRLVTEYQSEPSAE